MIWRALVIVFGVSVVGAATHANVVHAGGYGSDAAPLALAVAALLAVGMGFVGIVWNEGRWVGAIALAICLIAGELYWLGSSAEREIAAREELSAPAAAIKAKRDAADTRLGDAKEAKKVADAAAISEAAKPGCKVNCAKLLSDAQAIANTELAAARAALADLPMARSATPLPDRLGVASWAWDLIMAALRAVTVMGGSLAIGLALRSRPQRVEIVVDTPKTSASVAQRRQIATRTSDGLEHVSQFLRAAVRPDPAGAASLRELHVRYDAWCRARAVEPLPPAELGRDLRSVIDAIGLECEPRGRDVIVRGAAMVG